MKANAFIMHLIEVIFQKAKVNSKCIEFIEYEVETLLFA